MQSFKTYISDNQSENLEEKAIQFNKRAYPKFGQVVILSGGAGSGKGFLRSNLISLEGKVLDVDRLKELATASTVFAAKVKSEIGINLKDLDLKNPDNVSKVHDILGGLYKLDKKVMNTFNQSVMSAHPDRKPNIIFDVTLKDMSKLYNIARTLENMGYNKKDIHLVWVMNKFDVAVKQNKERNRVVPDDIMFTTHEGAALTMAKIFNMGKDLQKYMDGDIYVAFNQARIDTDMAFSGRVGSNVDTTDLPFINKDGGSYIKTTDYVQLKRVGKRQTALRDIEPSIRDKVSEYIPKTITW